MSPSRSQTDRKHVSRRENENDGRWRIKMLTERGSAEMDIAQRWSEAQRRMVGGGCPLGPDDHKSGKQKRRNPGPADED